LEFIDSVPVPKADDLEPALSDFEIEKNKRLEVTMAKNILDDI
jgi:hypothetical protein